MKKSVLIYGSLATIFATFILYYVTESETIADIATIMVVSFLGVAVLTMMLIPLYFYIKQPINNTYAIKKCNHYSGKRFRFFFRKRKLSATLTFHKTCRYEGDNQITEQINKVVGFGSLNHHKNSIRIGWRYNVFNDNIDLFTYEYNKGKRTIIYMKSVKIGTPCDVSISSSKVYWFGKYLFPYFGGKAPAPHTIKISVIYR